MQNNEDYLTVIYQETMSENGFLWKIRVNQIDREGFDRLIQAIEGLKEQFRNNETISRLAVACLFEAPWEIENTIDHYRSKDPDLGKEVSNLAGRLRESINDLLWDGLEKYYKNL